MRMMWMAAMIRVMMTVSVMTAVRAALDQGLRMDHGVDDSVTRHVTLALAMDVARSRVMVVGLALALGLVPVAVVVMTRIQVLIRSVLLVLVVGARRFVV